MIVLGFLWFFMRCYVLCEEVFLLMMLMNEMFVLMVVVVIV